MMRPYHLAAAALLAALPADAIAQAPTGMKMPPGFFIVTGALENAAAFPGRTACYAVVVRANESVSTYKIIFGRSFGSYPTREAGYEALRRGGWTCRPGAALCEFRINCTDERLPITIPPPG